MFANLTSYLFGSQQNTHKANDEAVNFHEIEEEDWTLIDTSSERNENTDDSLILSEETYKGDIDGPRRQRSNSCEDKINRCSPLRELSPSCINEKSVQSNVQPWKKNVKSRSSSSTSSESFMEESWFVTPPPCFVSEPYDTKPSSLENLLIEQPGMSIPNCISQTTVEQCNFKHQQAGSLKSEKASKPTVKVEMKVLKLKSSLKKPAKTESIEKCEEKQVGKDKQENALPDDGGKQSKSKSKAVVVKKEDRRRELLEIREEKKFLTTCQAQLHSVQKVEQKVATQFLKRNLMDRQNKVQFELSSSQKRQRRADLNKKHSGVNNNRKCCY